MDGTKLPPEIAKLSKEKEITLFVDGDRGGKLIANNVIEHADVKFVAVAPEGKEVEELTGKEILQALRKAIPVSDYLRGNGNSFKEKEEKSESTEVSFSGDVKAKLRELYSEKLEGTKSALLLDGNFDVIRKVGNREIASAVKGSRTKVAALILDGTATSSLIRLCDENGIQYFAATNFASTEDAKVKLVSL
jgi:DNA primase